MINNRIVISRIIVVVEVEGYCSRLILFWIICLMLVDCDLFMKCMVIKLFMISVIIKIVLIMIFGLVSGMIMC